MWPAGAGWASGSLSRIGFPLGARKPGVRWPRNLGWPGAYLRKVHGGSVACVSASSPTARDRGTAPGLGPGSPGGTDTLALLRLRVGISASRAHAGLLEFPRCVCALGVSVASTLGENCLGEYEDVACHYGESFSEQLGDREQVSSCFPNPPLMPLRTPSAPGADATLMDPCRPVSHNGSARSQGAAGGARTRSGLRSCSRSRGISDPLSVGRAPSQSSAPCRVIRPGLGCHRPRIPHMLSLS